MIYQIGMLTQGIFSLWVIPAIAVGLVMLYMLFRKNPYAKK